MFKKICIKFYKTKGGGAKAVYKLYKKTGNLVSDRIPYQGNRLKWVLFPVLLYFDVIFQLKLQF